MSTEAEPATGEQTPEGAGTEPLSTEQMLAAQTGESSAPALQPLARLRQILARVRSGNVSRLPTRDLEELSELYRYACTQVAERESRGESAQALAQLRGLASTAHGILFRGINRPKQSLLRRTVVMLTVSSPRAIRAEWRLLLGSFVLFYGLAAAGYYAVANDLSMAYSLFDPATVAGEIQQLTELEPGESFRGNFTFGIGESPQTASMIMFHNMGIGVLFFVSALIPILYLFMLMNNALMVGTYTAVAGHWDQAGSLSSILWCHGVIELQTFILAATAGLVLVRAVISPGARTRGFALKQAASRAWELFAPVFPLLFVSGLIEGFISPHMPIGTRLSVGALTGLGLIMWATLCGRGEQDPDDSAGSPSV